MKVHSITGYQAGWVPAYVANGVVGLRPDEALQSGYCTVNGYAGAHPEDGVESWLYAPYPVALQVLVGNQPIEARLQSQSYDFACGEMRSNLSFSGTSLRAQVLTFCSRSLPHVVAQQVRVTAGADARFTLRVGVDGSRAQGDLLESGDGTFHRRRAGDGWALWQASAGQSCVSPALLGVAQHTAWGAHEAAKSFVPGGFDSGFGAQVTVELRAGDSLVARQMTALVPGVAHPEPHRQAIRVAYLAGERGFQQLREENRAVWAELWRGRPLLHGASTRWQEISDACFFYLHSSAHRSSPCSTGLFGVGQWPGYHCFRGHVFWDIETFAFPPLLLTQPEAAEAILDYRFRHLDAARRHARMFGWAGAQFPWESGPLSGTEVTPSGWPHIIHEQHISLDVAFAFAQMAHATDDEAFRRQRAWPVLHEVARWLCSRLELGPRGWELRRSMGICEDYPTDNNAFVLLAAKCVLREAAALAQRLGAVPRESEQWLRMAAYLALPRDEAQVLGGALPRCDNYEPQGRDAGATETLAAFYPYTAQLDAEVTRATQRFYLEQGQQVLGMPMLPPLFSVHAARLGERELALEMLERGVGDYVIEPFLQMDEFGCTYTETKPRVGPYLAHAGAVVMNFLMGFPGLQLSSDAPEKWGRFPVALPQGWSSIEVERLWAHRRPHRMTASQGNERACVSRLD
jgi:trehalose/maltose hydrolase-like predicted phosphorylase